MTKKNIIIVWEGILPSGRLSIFIYFWSRKGNSCLDDSDLRNACIQQYLQTEILL